MPKRGNAVHVSTHRRHYVRKDGVERNYETHLLRRSYREDGKVKNETVANLSHLPAHDVVTSEEPHPFQSYLRTSEHRFTVKGHVTSA